MALDDLNVMLRGIRCRILIVGLWCARLTNRGRVILGEWVVFHYAAALGQPRKFRQAAFQQADRGVILFTRDAAPGRQVQEFAMPGGCVIVDQRPCQWPTDDLELQRCEIDAGIDEAIDLCLAGDPHGIEGTKEFVAVGCLFAVAMAQKDMPVLAKAKEVDTPAAAVRIEAGNQTGSMANKPFELAAFVDVDDVHARLLLENAPVQSIAADYNNQRGVYLQTEFVPEIDMV